MVKGREQMQSAAWEGYGAHDLLTELQELLPELKSLLRDVSAAQAWMWASEAWDHLGLDPEYIGGTGGDFFFYPEDTAAYIAANFEWANAKNELIEAITGIEVFKSNPNGQGSWLALSAEERAMYESWAEWLRAALESA